uniref:Uncharacterized protein n=1 Tax=Tanacetum cinerariifolium TaxID=118510 RepID=A0A6L2MXE1_TANCI|nr:hypothetical protein [Tanacetum cinerariifolium]
MAVIRSTSMRSTMHTHNSIIQCLSWIRFAAVAGIWSGVLRLHVDRCQYLGGTSCLGSPLLLTLVFGLKTGQDCSFTQSGFKESHTVSGDGVTIPSDAVRTYKIWRQNVTASIKPWKIRRSDGVRILVTPSRSVSYIYKLVFKVLSVQLLGDELYC